MMQTKANRIIIFDQHFNPTVSLQAIYRLYRYGQTKPVFCYSLLTQGTTEEKVYGRGVNKTGVSFRVIDKKTIERCFTTAELDDLLQNLIWVQCAKCEKWRVLVNEVSEENVPEDWECSMNTTDPHNNTCSASEKSQVWYENKYYSNNPTPSPSKNDSKQSSPSLPSSILNGKKHTVESERLIKNDDILGYLLGVTNEGKKQKLICDYYFHDALMETKQSSDELEKVRRLLNL
jgi:hypothetical protein